MTSDGLENCFIVARNCRSAKKVEVDYCGFAHDEVMVERVLSITIAQEQSYRRRCKKDQNLKRWPWYADQWLLQKVGAQFRDIDGCNEILIDDIVYTTGSERPIRPRTVGKKAIKQLMEDPTLRNYGEEDIFSPSQMHLYKLLGICIARCQEIEHYIAHSFLLGISEKQKRRYDTINDLTEGWKKKTFGQLIAAIEEAYDIEPTVKICIQLFLDMRNQLVHGLTTSPRNDIHTSWGQDEMVSFLMLFEMLSRPIRKAFRASFYASIDFGVKQWLNDNEKFKRLLSRKQDKEIDIFFAFFSPKPS